MPVQVPRCACARRPRERDCSLEAPCHSRVPCARLARRVKYAPQRMDLCGRLADAVGDVTEGHLKCLPSKAASCTSSLPRGRPLCALDALTAVRFRFGYDEEPC